MATDEVGKEGVREEGGGTLPLKTKRQKDEGGALSLLGLGYIEGEYKDKGGGGGFIPYSYKNCGFGGLYPFRD